MDFLLWSDPQMQPFLIYMCLPMCKTLGVCGVFVERTIGQLEQTDGLLYNRQYRENYWHSFKEQATVQTLLKLFILDWYGSCFICVFNYCFNPMANK